MGSRDGWRGINEERKKRYIFELTTDLIFFFRFEPKKIESDRDGRPRKRVL